jgi:hypothetical protein
MAGQPKSIDMLVRFDTSWKVTQVYTVINLHCYFSSLSLSFLLYGTLYGTLLSLQVTLGKKLLETTYDEGPNNEVQCIIRRCRYC